MIKRLIVGVFAAAVLIVTITGCNTVRGAGADLESIGSAVSGTGGD